MAGGSARLDTKRSVSALALKGKLPSILPFGKNRERVERLDEKAGFEWVGEALTRTQEALETLWEAEELHRLLFVKVPQPRFVCDARTLRILAVNEATVRQYKFSRHEFHRMRVTDLGAPESLADFKKYCQELSSPRGGDTNGQDNVFRHRRKDGSLIDVEIDAAVIPCGVGGCFCYWLKMSPRSGAPSNGCGRTKPRPTRWRNPIPSPKPARRFSGRFVKTWVATGVNCGVWIRRQISCAVPRPGIPRHNSCREWSRRHGTWALRAVKESLVRSGHAISHFGLPTSPSSQSRDERGRRTSMACVPCSHFRSD